MITGVEIDFVAADSREALVLYEKIFEVERIEVTDLARGQNEAVFSIYGTRFHVLDENEECQLIAPKPGVQQSVWFNIAVPDIKKVHENALREGCMEIMAVTDMGEMGASNSMFADSFGYVWMLHQIHREVSLEERIRIMTDK